MTATGEPIFTGKFRTAPGPRFWLAVYLVLDFGSVFPYLAATAATPVMILLLGGRMPDPDSVPLHWWMHKLTATGIFVASVIPLIFGGKVYNSLKAVMSVKLVTVFGFLLIVALLYSSPSTWVDIGSGFLKFGTVPVMSGEDRNGNGRLDPGEDWDGDGHLDVVERRLEPTVDSDGDGRPDTWERGPQGQLVKHEDLDGDGFLDGPNVENVFLSWFSKGALPTIDFTLIAFIAAMAAIAGNGGLSNTPISNFTRDQGWGMGHHVGAIPSMVGGQGITLSHVGSVFEVNRQSLPRWRRWYRHVARDQCAIWIPACFVGLALPSMLSVEFLRRGTDWTSSSRLRQVDPARIGRIYFGLIMGYSVLGLAMLWLNAPTALIKFATISYNFALGISCCHTLILNTVLLPRELRPGWFVRIAMALGGIFFFLLGLAATLRELGQI